LAELIERRRTPVYKNYWTSQETVNKTAIQSLKMILQTGAIQFSQKLKMYKNIQNMQACIFWSGPDIQIFAGVLRLSK